MRTETVMFNSISSNMLTKEQRIEKAVALFKEGFNCSQSVVAAYADMYPKAKGMNVAWMTVSDFRSTCARKQ